MAVLKDWPTEAIALGSVHVPFFANVPKSTESDIEWRKIPE